MDFRVIRLEKVIPLFTGALCSLFLCVFVWDQFGILKLPVSTAATEDSEESFDFLFSADEDAQDPILEYYRNSDYTEWVVEFFTGVCKNREVAQAILGSTSRFNVSPALAFALCWEESRFDSRAINRHNRDGSIDRGLFQLNNRSFPNLHNYEYFVIGINSYYGISHLRYCLDTGGSEISALAMYNAGTGRIRSTGAPEVTLNYISRILNNKSKIESRFHSSLIKEEERRIEERADRASQLLFNRTL